jgi:hypothetical protein
MERYTAQLRKIQQNQGICPWGVRCDRKHHCELTHPHQIDCQHGTACQNLVFGCPFKHDLPRFICPSFPTCLDAACPFAHRSH